MEELEPSEFVPYTNADGTKGYLKCYATEDKAKPRRQFDIYALKTARSCEPEEVIQELYQTAFVWGEHAAKVAMIEAWNAGTIEELLESWVEE